MENELSTEVRGAENYYDALKKNEKNILSVIGTEGENFSGQQLYKMTEEFFLNNVDKFIFEDLINDEHCPILAFSDAILETVYKKPEKFVFGKTRFLDAIKKGASQEKYLLRKELLDDIIIKCCFDGKKSSTQISNEQFESMVTVVELNASPKSLASFFALLKSEAEKVKEELETKGFGPFKKKISEEDKEKVISNFEKNASKIFSGAARVIESCTNMKRTDFYDKVSPVEIEELFKLLDDVRKNFGRDDNGNKFLNVSYEEFLLQFINYYVIVTQSKKLTETCVFVPVSNWKLNESFRILGEYSCNPYIQYQLIEKYAKEKSNTMVYFPFEIISDILCKSESGWDINKKCLDVIFEVAKENENEKPKIEKLVTQVVTNSSRDERVRNEAFSRYFDLVKNDLRVLVPWIRDSVAPKIFSEKYCRAVVFMCAKIFSFEGTDGADDGLDASRQKCIDYLKNNYKEDSLEISNTVKNFLCLKSCKNSVLKENVYEQFYGAFGDDGVKKIQFNREILEGLRDDENSKVFLCHVCSASLNLAGKYSDSQKNVLKDCVDYLKDCASSGDLNATEVLTKFIVEGKEKTISKDALSHICSFENLSSIKISSKIVEQVCHPGEKIKNEYDASILKIALDFVLHSSQENIQSDKILLDFLGIDFSVDSFSLVEYGKKAVNFIWKKSENNSPMWSEIKFDYIQTVSKCRNVDILQYAFEKACK